MRKCILNCFAVILLLVLLFDFVGCSSGGRKPDQPSTTLTSKQIAEIQKTSDAITARLRSAADPHSDSALLDAKTLAEAQANVESASIINGDLVVKYKNAGQEVWVKDSPSPSPPADIAELNALSLSIARQAAGLTRSPVGTQKAVLINALSDDPYFQNFGVAFGVMRDTLKACGFDVIEINGSQVTTERLKGLSDCSVFVQLGHGRNEAPFAVQIGTLWDNNTASLEWQSGEVVKMNIPWGMTDRERNFRSFQAITGKFWKTKYSSQLLKHALFFNCACYGASYPDYSQSLFDIGVAEYSGWTDIQDKAPFTASRILLKMAGGKTMQEAVEDLPAEYTTCTVNGKTASFWYGPDSEKTITLCGINTSRPEIVINSPIDGQTITSREVTVSGQIIPPSSRETRPPDRAAISVNGQSEVLALDISGRFSQPVGLRSGSNTIKVSSIGKAEYSKEISVTGNFPGDLLYTTLWWNTDLNDIDLHLKPISGAGGATDECFYYNMTPSWGASLDVDDVNGYGPEHISARSLPPGVYKIYVHYFDNHGQTNPAVVNVSVSTNGQPSRIFSLNGGRRMTSMGDQWDVCTIEYPSGNISVLDNFVPATRGLSLEMYPPK